MLKFQQNCLFLAAWFACIACAGNNQLRVVQPILQSRTDVTLVWAWDHCLKSVEGLRAIEKVRDHFRSNNRVEVLTVFMDKADRTYITHTLEKMHVHLPVFLDTDC